MNGEYIPAQEAFEAWEKDHRYTKAEFDAGAANIWNQDWTTGDRLRELTKMAFMAGREAEAAQPTYFTIKVMTEEDPPTTLAHIRMGHEQRFRLDVRGLQWVVVEGRK